MRTSVAAMDVKLKVIGGKSNGVEIAAVAPQFLIGRADECQLRPKSDFVSRRHAMIAIDGAKATIVDLGSRTGTFLNGKVLAAQTPAEIKHDDIVKIGPLEFSVVIKHGLDRQKHAKVKSLEEAATRTAQRKNVDDADVDQWLQADPNVDDGLLDETLSGNSPTGTIMSAADLLGQTPPETPTTDDAKKSPAAEGRPDQAASDMLKNYLRRR